MNARLPGEDLVEAGIEDLRVGRETVAAFLVAIGAPRLRRIGLQPPEGLPTTPEHRFYDLLARVHGNGAHSRYNSWIRTLVSYERAAEREKSNASSPAS